MLKLSLLYIIVLITIGFVQSKILTSNNNNVKPRENRHHRLVLSSHYKDAWVVQNASALPKFFLTRGEVNLSLDEALINHHKQNLRQVKSSTRSYPAYFNDPLFHEQWYLQNDGQTGRPGYDLNITWAWARGFTGKAITCSVLDDGVQDNNLDLVGNYDKSISYTVSENESIKSASSNATSPHGTFCATIIAGVSNNSVCGVGVAFNAKVGGVKLLKGKISDIEEATALRAGLSSVDVYSSSWGPPDDGMTVDGPGPLARKALEEGVTKGRDGKGSIYVWAAGNGGYEHDNCNLDGYTSSIHTLSVSALDDEGRDVDYGEPCAAILAGIPITSDSHVTSSSDNSSDVVVTDLDGKCNNHFQGTSAAAPIMTGIVALVLQANPSLTWRDIQHLVVSASSPTDEGWSSGDWKTNAAGHKYHLKQVPTKPNTLYYKK